MSFLDQMATLRDRIEDLDLALATARAERKHTVKRFNRLVADHPSEAREGGFELIGGKSKAEGNGEAESEE